MRAKVCGRPACLLSLSLLTRCVCHRFRSLSITHYLAPSLDLQALAIKREQREERARARKAKAAEAGDDDAGTLSDNAEEVSAPQPIPRRELGPALVKHPAVSDEEEMEYSVDEEEEESEEDSDAFESD